MGTETRRKAAPDPVQRLALTLERLEALLPPAEAPDFQGAVAFRWRKRRFLGMERATLEPVAHPALIGFDDLQHVGAQKDAIRPNTEQFVRGFPANNVLR